MINKKIKFIVFLLCLLSLISVSIHISDWYSWKSADSDKQVSFQRYVGGLGLGASLSPKWGFLNFDPRIDGTDETALFPVPGIYSYSPDRGIHVGDFKEIVPVFDK